MSMFRICDWCGEKIHPADYFTFITIESTRPDSATHLAGHYHEQQCREAIVEHLQLGHEFGSILNSHPVTTNQSVGQRRRKHSKPEGDS